MKGKEIMMLTTINLIISAVQVVLLVYIIALLVRKLK